MTPRISGLFEKIVIEIAKIEVQSDRHIDIGSTNRLLTSLIKFISTLKREDDRFMHAIKFAVTLIDIVEKSQGTNESLKHYI